MNLIPINFLPVQHEPDACGGVKKTLPRAATSRYGGRRYYSAVDASGALAARR
jgi:hypothetical protein